MFEFISSVLETFTWFNKWLLMALPIALISGIVAAFISYRKSILPFGNKVGLFLSSIITGICVFLIAMFIVSLIVLVLSVIIVITAYIFSWIFP